MKNSHFPIPDIIHEKLEHQDNRQEIICADGFKMSVQASRTHYCTPRINGIENKYEEVEIGYPSRPEPLLKKYADSYGMSFSNEIYAYVPAAVVYNVLQKHGGMIGGELPRLDIEKSADLLTTVFIGYPL